MALSLSWVERPRTEIELMDGVACLATLCFLAGVTGTSWVDESSEVRFVLVTQRVAGVDVEAALSFLGALPPVVMRICWRGGV
jgi:hypothetical protein